MPNGLIKMKQMFFDRKAVTNAVDKAARRVLSRFGAFVRQTARTSIRRRKGISQPGKPPHSHSGELRRLIFFGYDPRVQSVVIGPTRFSKGTVPALLEYGGRHENRTYKPRPFMGPALEQEREKLPALWADSVT